MTHGIQHGSRVVHRVLRADALLESVGPQVDRASAAEALAAVCVEGREGGEFREATEAGPREQGCGHPGKRWRAE